MATSSHEPPTADPARQFVGLQCVRCRHVSLIRVDPKATQLPTAAACVRCGAATHPVQVTGPEDSPPGAFAPMQGDRGASDSLVLHAPRAASQSTRGAESPAVADGGTRPASLRVPHPLRIVSELWYAWYSSRRLLALFDAVRREQSGLVRRTLYEAVVIRWTGRDRAHERSILRRAEQSFTTWMGDRDLRFRDVVLLAIVDRYMAAHPERLGVLAHMERVVARAIPGRL